MLLGAFFFQIASGLSLFGFDLSVGVLGRILDLLTVRLISGGGEGVIRQIHYGTRGIPLLGCFWVGDSVVSYRVLGCVFVYW